MMSGGVCVYYSGDIFTLFHLLTALCDASTDQPTNPSSQFFLKRIIADARIFHGRVCVPGHK
jgi:hypothetical protein